MILEPPAHSDMPWRLEDIDFSAIQQDLVREDESLFFMLVTASFIESGSDLYTKNLVEHYRDFPEVQHWLASRWEREELQHGRALRHYVQAVWPEYDWTSAYGEFFAEYAPLCAPDHLETDPALELAARCVVETGTSSYYRMLFEAAAEPVLRRLLDNIRRDEVRHFKNFYHFFREQQVERRSNRARLALCIARRTAELTHGDGWYAFRHAYGFRYPGRTATRADYRGLRRQMRRMAEEHFPCRMTAQMLLTPLDFSGPVRSGLVRALSAGIHLSL